MALANTLWLSQLAGHVILSILSLCIIVPLSYNQRYFRRHCILFTTGKWREEDGMFDVNWASNAFCIYPIFTGCYICVAAVMQIIRYTRFKNQASFFALFADVVVGISMLVSSIVSAIVITLGFIVWCDNMTERFPSCEISAGQNIIHGMDTEQIDTSEFYIEMGTAQFGAWGSFAVSVGITVIALLKLIHNHQVRNIKVSMFLERQRLVNQHQAQLDGRSTPPLDNATSSDSDK